MTPASSEARRRVVLMLLRQGRIGPGAAADPGRRAPGAEDAIEREDPEQRDDVG